MLRFTSSILFRWYYDELYLRGTEGSSVFSPLFSYTSIPTIQFVVKMWHIKRWCVMTIIHYCFFFLLFFWHQNAATSWGPLTLLSMIVALVLSRRMLTYGMWQRGHTGAARQMALMMITKKRDALPSEALYARICPIAKDESCTRAFIKNISHSQNTACLYRAWQMLWSERLVRERETIYMLIMVYYHFLYATISLFCSQKCQHFYSSLKSKLFLTPFKRIPKKNSVILFCHHHFVTRFSHHHNFLLLGGLSLGWTTTGLKFGFTWSFQNHDFSIIWCPWCHCSVVILKAKL